MTHRRPKRRVSGRTPVHASWSRFKIILAIAAGVGFLGGSLLAFSIGRAEEGEPPSPLPAAIHALKYNDANGNSERDEDEALLADWEICLSRRIYAEGENGGEETLELISCQTTDVNGLTSWTDLEPGSYELDEEERAGWSHTTRDPVTIELEEGQEVTAEFGNKRGQLIVYKYDYDTEEIISGWNICLYEAIFDEETEEYQLEALVECQETIDDYNEEEDDMGPFHGAAVFSSENLDPDKWYIVDEEEREGWRLEYVQDTDGNEYYNEDDSSDIKWESGQVPIWLGESFFEEAEDTQLYLYNRDITGGITAFKYFDENRRLLVRDWEICLFGLVQEGGPSVSECKRTVGDGMVSWQNLFPGIYLLDEEERNGWVHQGFSGIGEWEEENQELGQVTVRLEEGGDISINFLNWIDDQTPPVSAFDDSLDHQVIETEILALELTGVSTDNPGAVLGKDGEEEAGHSSGLREAALTVLQIGGAEAVADYPAQSFFDVFNELNCPDSEAIPIEIVALDLVSVDPITVQWSNNWAPPGQGIYCFEVSATDNAGNVERTAQAGPVAYVSVAKISQQEAEAPAATSFTVHWTTDHPATSRVIYDTESHLILGEAPNYGYAFSTLEANLEPKVTEHSVTVSELEPATTYYYRTVSVGSPAAVSAEGSLTTASDAGDSGDGGGSSQTSNAAPNGGGSGPSGNFSPTLSNATSSNFVLPVPTPTPTLAPLPSPSGQVLGVATYQFTRNLRPWSRGNDVTELQKRLTTETVYRSPITGYYGWRTIEGVKAFQRKYGIRAIGVVGPQTRAQLNKM